jgi:glycosyltransferase involved in cell wall biosynthesis
MKTVHRDRETIVGFLQDAWFPGIECFRYVADLKGINLKIVGFWHAGAYDDTDLLGLAGLHRWSRGSEKTWFQICDVVCVGTNYHKNRLVAALGTKASDVDKIHVTGCPVEVPIGLQEKVAKENIVIWPHRIAPDKHPEIFGKLSKEPRFEGVKFARTKDLIRNKSMYHRALAKAKVVVSTASHENFGISVIEAMLLGCWPVVPDGLAYVETVPNSHLRYNSYEELVEKVEEYLQTTNPFRYQDIDPPNYHQVSVTDQICQIIREVADK